MYDLMKRKEAGLKSPLAKARGLGSAHEGLHEWMLARITSVAAIFLTLWFAVSMVDLIGEGYYNFILWLHEPMNAILMSAFIVNSYTHAKLGLKVIIEDYVHSTGSKFRELLALELIYWGGMIATLFSIAKVAFGVVVL